MSNPPFLIYQGCLPARVQLFSVCQIFANDLMDMTSLSWSLAASLQQTWQGQCWESSDSSPTASL